MNNDRPTLAMLIVGTIIFVTVTAAWLFAEFNHIGTGALLAFAVPVVGALFIGHQLGATATAAQQAASQTNGALDARIKAGATAALAERDATRTMQAQQSQSTASGVLVVGSEPEADGTES